MENFIDKARAGKYDKSVVNFGAAPDLSWMNTTGSGVAYLTATAGATSYNANALVTR